MDAGEEEQPAAPSRRWWPFGAAVAMGLAVAFCFVTAWDPIRESHPAYLICLVIAGVGAVSLGAWAWWTRPDPQASRTKRIVLRTLLVAGTVVPIALLVWLRPLGADTVALRALQDGKGVDVTSSNLVVRLQPDEPRSTGLVFYPGARVDPRAYAHILRPIAEAGYPVVIIKLPLNLAVLDSDAADAVVGDDDGIERWVVGGHSLGGAMAATYASTPRDELDGLLLYGAYPADDLSDRTELEVTSVYGTEDGLTTVDDIERTKHLLPPQTEFVPIEGGIHSFFGDYGHQRGDGEATIGRGGAQDRIVAATLDLMARVDAGG